MQRAEKIDKVKLADMTEKIEMLKKSGAKQPIGPIMIKVKVTARRFEYDELKGKLRPDERIVILSCDSCAKLNNCLGGELGIAGLAEKLMADGFNVIHSELLNVACLPDELKDRLNGS